MLVSASGGCAHFRDAEERAAARQQASAQPSAPALAEAPSEPAPQPAPVPVPVSPPASAALPPAPAPAPVAAEPAPALAAPVVPSAPEPVPAPPVAAPAEPAPPPPAAPPAAIPAPPEAAPAPPSPPPVPTAAIAPATSDAIIIFANVPGAHCTTCETVKISVAPSGQVLLERGYWAGNHSDWRYKRTRAEVRPERAAAFAASLLANRPAGEQSGSCPGPATGDGISIEWIEADRHDRLTLDSACPADRQIAETLRHAPDQLGLRNLDFPWGPAAR